MTQYLLRMRRRARPLAGALFSCAVVFGLTTSSGLAQTVPTQTPQAQTASVEAKTIAETQNLTRINDTAFGTLLFETVHPGLYAAAPLVATDIKTDVTGLTARTVITQRFENPTDKWVEGVYAFPLPERAGVDALKMQIGNRFIEGQIKEREEARRIYEQAKAEGRKASLVEQQRPNLFTNEVANIGPHEVVVIQIEYQEDLLMKDGKVSLRHPLVVAPRYMPMPNLELVQFNPDGFASVTQDLEKITSPVLDPRKQDPDETHNPVTLTINLEAGFAVDTVSSAYHEIELSKKSGNHYTVAFKEGSDVPADRDFELTWAAKPGKAPGAALFSERHEGEDYVYLMITPPLMDKPVVDTPREITFVIDNSGSMGGESIRQAKAGLLLALDRLRPSDHFNVIRFDDTMDMVFPAPVKATPEAVNAAKKYVAALEAEGGTEMAPALEAALRDTKVTDNDTLRQVIFLTDGAIGNEDQLFEIIGNSLGRSRLFTVGIGSAPNSHFMTRAARLGRGTFTYIGDVSEVTTKMAELFSRIERPVLTNITLGWTGAQDLEAWPMPIPDLYAGEPIVVAAKMKKAEGELVLSGRYGNKKWATALDLADASDGSGLAKIWARRKIASIEESRFDGATYQDVDKGVLETALAYGLVSRLTSLVAVDVTPSRPGDETLTRTEVPLNLPNGWDFDKVFGEPVPALAPPPVYHDASMLMMGQQFASLKTITVTGARMGASPIHLAQGGTLSNLAMLIGLIMIALASLILANHIKGARRARA